jgi:hypothetical protein
MKRRWSPLGSGFGKAGEGYIRISGKSPGSPGAHRKGLEVICSRIEKDPHEAGLFFHNVYPKGKMID